MSVDTLPSSEECNCFAVRAAAKRVDRQWSLPLELRENGELGRAQAGGRQELIGGLRDVP
jgi:hypothetical protein